LRRISDENLIQQFMDKREGYYESVQREALRVAEVSDIDDLPLLGA